MTVRFLFTTQPAPAEGWDPQPICLEVARPAGRLVEDGDPEAWGSWETAQEERLEDMGYRFIQYLHGRASAAFFKGLQRGLAEVVGRGEALEYPRISRQEILEIIQADNSLDLTATSTRALEAWAREEE